MGAAPERKERQQAAVSPLHEFESRTETVTAISGIKRFRAATLYAGSDARYWRREGTATISARIVVPASATHSCGRCYGSNSSHTRYAEHKLERDLFSSTA